jgi:DNA-binding transcriptional LysR family regulator
MYESRIRAPLQSDDLSLFVVTVEHGSFASAGMAAGLTASAVSKRIARLEARLGVQLLLRTTRSLTLTEAGSGYFERARRIAVDIRAAEQAATLLSDEPRGNLRINCPAAFSEKQLMKFVPEFLQRYPHVRVSLIVGDRSPLSGELEDDIVIRSAVVPLGEFHSHRLSSNRWIICAATSYLERHGMPLRPADLQGHNCLVMSGAGHTSEEWLFEVDGIVQPVRVAGNFGAFGGAVYEVVKAGLGIAKLSEFLVAKDIFDGTLRALLANAMPRDTRILYLSYRRDRPVPAKTAAFVQFLLERIGAEPPWTLATQEAGADTGTGTASQSVPAG